MTRKGLPGVAWRPFLLPLVLTACSEATPTTSSPIVSSATTYAFQTSGPGAACISPLDTANTVTGVISEQTADGTRPISDAIVELFLGDSGGESRDTLAAVRATLTTAAGRYQLCLPPPVDPSGTTASDGRPFEVRVRKDGYLTAGQSFRYAYSVWDYGGVELNLELVRD